MHLDPRAEGVVVPAWFKRQPQLVLQVGLNMPVPIPDLRIDEDGMSCTLSFNRSPFFCVIPWSSAYAMVGEDGRGMVWPDDVPPEVASQANCTRPSPPPGSRPLRARSPWSNRRPNRRASPPRNQPKGRAPCAAKGPIRPRRRSRARGSPVRQRLRPRPTRQSEPRQRPTMQDAFSPRSRPPSPRGASRSPRPHPTPPLPALRPPPGRRPRAHNPRPTLRARQPSPAAERRSERIPPYLRIVK